MDFIHINRQKRLAKKTLKTEYVIYKQTEYIQCRTEHIQLEN